MKNLGEQIYLYRTKCGLSQLDISEKLDVSRQSVSKWENNTAVPELAKLVKLCELFGITLDELVNGSQNESTASQNVCPISQPQAEADNDVITITIKKPSFRRLKRTVTSQLSPKKIAGLCILGGGFLFLLIMNLFVWHGDIFSSFLWGILFLTCSAIFFFESKHCILFCTWTAWVWAYSFFRIDRNTPTCAITITVVLSLVTILYFLKTPSASLPKSKKTLIIGAVSSALLFFPLKFCTARLAHLLLPALGKIEDSYLAFYLTCVAFDLESLAEISVIAVFVCSIASLAQTVIYHRKKQTLS